ALADVLARTSSRSGPAPEPWIVWVRTRYAAVGRASGSRLEGSPCARRASDIAPGQGEPVRREAAGVAAARDSRRDAPEPRARGPADRRRQIVPGAGLASRDARRARVGICRWRFGDLRARRSAWAWSVRGPGGTGP